MSDHGLSIASANGNIGEEHAPKRHLCRQKTDRSLRLLRLPFTALQDLLNRVDNHRLPTASGDEDISGEHAQDLAEDSGRKDEDVGVIEKELMLSRVRSHQPQKAYRSLRLLQLLQIFWPCLLHSD